ncbi:hypothetical protein CK203_002559 [Vitis vinifera]|uniref:PGG domain-containing protein n=1 Tax=Vitis vinifera TaxID=29760 RepID=A0A438KHJ1_VITVI|nr:hypothetical protein CK203_002559 [Vitis vinifera]
MVKLFFIVPLLENTSVKLLCILQGIYVKKLGKEELPPLGNATSNDKRVDGKCPMNYQPCMNFRNVLIGTWNVLTQSGKRVNSEGGQTTSQNQDISDENLKEQTNNCLKGLWSIISKIAGGEMNVFFKSPLARNYLESKVMLGHEWCNLYKKFTKIRPGRTLPKDMPVLAEVKHALTNTTFIVSATCRKNSQNSDNQVKPYKHALENPEEGNASASPNQGARDVQKIRVMKEKHIWSAQIMKELLHCASPYEYDYSAGRKRLTFNMKDKGYVFDVDFSKGEVTLGPVEGNKQKDKKETPILIAAKNGITEMVMEILDFDDEGNSALHLVAMATHHQPWLIPGAALQMQWESSGTSKADLHREARRASKKMVVHGSTPPPTHAPVVAALIATVAFATSATVPGGINEGNGTPTLERKPAFNVFSISSLIALCFSVNSLSCFWPFSPQDTKKGISAGISFSSKTNSKYAAFPIYAVTCLPVAFFAVMQFPLYLDLMWATFRKVPKRSSTAVS